MKKKTYTLGLVAGDVIPSIDNAKTSAQMLIMGLYNEFDRLDHVNPQLINVTNDSIDIFLQELQPLDFLLIRRYTQSAIIKNVLSIKKQIKYKTCSFIEHHQDNFDYCFGFLNQKGTDLKITLPYVKKYMSNIEKTHKTILLDDYGNTDADMSDKIIKWIKPLLSDGYVIYQMCKKESDVQNGIIPLLQCDYKNYMNATSKIETFIQTHPGSYEHSVIDMVGRGIRTFIPDNEEKLGRGFYIPVEMVEELKLPTFKNQKELLSLIKKPVDLEFWNSRIHEMTEMKLIVNTIDDYFQRNIIDTIQKGKGNE